MHWDTENDEDNLFLKKFESMLKTNKVFFFDSDEFEEIIYHYLDSGKLSMANKALKLALEQHPNAFNLKLIQVEILVFEDKLEFADRLLEQLYVLQPTNDEIYIQKANICSKRNQHEKAIEYLKLALQYTDDYADVYSLLGMEYLFMDDLEQAKDAFIKCLENDPEDHSALYNIVYCFDFLDQPEHAITFLNEYIDKQPYSEIAWHQLGKQQYLQENYVKALQAYEYAILIDDNFSGAYFEKGKTYEKLKLYPEAIQCYLVTLEKEDPSGYAYYRIGKCYKKDKNADKALEYFLKAIHEDPLLDKAWIAITNHYIKQKDFNKALHYLGSAIELDNQNGKYWEKFSYINIELSFFEEAEFGFRKAFEMGNFNYRNFVLWIDLLKLIGDFDLAIEVVLTAIEMYPKEYELHYRAAGLYYLNNNALKGEQQLVKALKINTKNHTLFQNLFPTVWENSSVQNLIKSFL